MLDGSDVVAMDKLSYGYVEVVHYRYENLIKTFKKNKYAIARKDKCIFIKWKNKKVDFCGASVNYCLFVYTRDGQYIQEQINMLCQEYEEIMIELID